MYVLHSMEQPNYVPLLRQSSFLNKNFDLLFTYIQSTVYPHTTVPNLPLSYFPTHIYPPEAVLLPALPFAEKTGDDSGTLSYSSVCMVTNMSTVVILECL